MLLDAQSKFVVSLALGPRTAEMTQAVFADYYQRTNGLVPDLITTDQYSAYESVIVSTYDVSSTDEPYARVPDKLCYATVCKRREKGKVVEITVRTVIGTDEQLARALRNSTCSKTVNTSYVERFNGTARHQNARKARKTYNFSKDLDLHIAVTWLCITHYNFCWTVRTLRQLMSDNPLRYLQRTPAMAIGLTEQPWSLRRLLTHPIHASPGHSSSGEEMPRKREAG